MTVEIDPPPPLPVTVAALHPRPTSLLRHTDASPVHPAKAVPAAQRGMAAIAVWRGAAAAAAAIAAHRPPTVPDTTVRGVGVVPNGTDGTVAGAAAAAVRQPGADSELRPCTSAHGER